MCTKNSNSCFHFVFLDIPDNRAGIGKKLALLSLLPRSRARRLLNHWDHPISLRIRGQEHAANVLAGTNGRSTSMTSSSHHHTSLGDHFN